MTFKKNPLRKLKSTFITTRIWMPHKAKKIKKFFRLLTINIHELISMNDVHWWCWCVCGLMMSLWPEERNSISLNISHRSERWEIDCFTHPIFHSWVSAQNIQPEAILALPSVIDAKQCRTSKIPTIIDLYA